MLNNTTISLIANCMHAISTCCRKRGSLFPLHSRQLMCHTSGIECLIHKFIIYINSWAFNICSKRKHNHINAALLYLNIQYCQWYCLFAKKFPSRNAERINCIPLSPSRRLPLANATILWCFSEIVIVDAVCHLSRIYCACEWEKGMAFVVKRFPKRKRSMFIFGHIIVATGRERPIKPYQINEKYASL